MPTLEIKQLYNLSRFPESSTKVLSIILYFPIGILLAGVRTALGLLLILSGYVLPDLKVLNVVFHKLICFTLGISISVENLERKEDVDAYISNQVSVLDHLVLNSVTGCLTPGIKLPPLLSTAFGVKSFGTASSLASFKKNIVDDLAENKVQLFFQPEKHLTNGSGILKFSTLPFEMCNKIQPVTIRTYRPIVDLAVTTMDNSYWSDIFCFLFTPCTIYQLKFLPASERKGTDEVRFSEKMRMDMAGSLQVQAVNYSATDMKEWEKRYKAEQVRVRPVQTTAVTVNPELHRMTMQVREVLPVVPYNVIYRDLSKTRNVDITITNILEGHVTYTPESVPQPISTSSPQITISSPSSSSKSVSSSSPADMFNTAASSFGKNAQERALSFHERKQLLIANARKRYIEKHNLQNLMLNNC